MDPDVFRQEIITSLELELETLKSNTLLDAAYLTEFRDQMNHLASTAQTIRDAMDQ